MEDRGETTAFAVVESLTGWWELAGVDSAVSDTPVKWLEDDLPSKSVVATANPTSSPKNNLPTKAPSVAWPADIATLRHLVTAGAALPGNGYSPLRFASIGPETCDIMIVSDLPDILDSVDAASTANAALLQRMMAAIGVDVADCHRTWLSTSLPPTGEVPEHDLPDLADFLQYQLKLINPKSIILLGSSACRALLNEELMNARAELRNINHNGSNMYALATFHPRTLIARPATKAQAWRDLQMFANKAVQ